MIKNHFVKYSLVLLIAWGCNNREQNNSPSPITHLPLLEYKGDTVRYIKENFILNKEDYIGKEMKYFLNNLEIPIYRCMVFPNHGSNTFSSMYIHFYSDKIIDEKIADKIDPIVIIISFNNFIQTEDIYPVLIETKGFWNDDVHRFFEDKKIKNIQLLDYFKF